MNKIFDGRAFALGKKAVLWENIKKLKKEGIKPCLASIYLSSDPGSVLYTKLKSGFAKSIGIGFFAYKIYPKDPKKITKLLSKLNQDFSVNGILVQKPSGDNHFSSGEWMEIVLSLSPQKDIDGLTPENLGLLAIGKPRFIPATVKAVLSILDYAKVNLLSKNVVILGASEILGKPLSMILTDRGATVSLLHKETKDIPGYTSKADILISATGSPGLIKGDMVKTGSVIIDVGSPQADVVRSEVIDKVSFISPVPNGVGPVTVVSLMENLLQTCLPKVKTNTGV